MGQETDLGQIRGHFSPNRVERFYFWAVLIIGLLILIYSSATTPHSSIDGWDFVVFLLLSTLAEQTFVTLPHGSKISASFSVLLTALLLFNIPVVIVLAALGNLITVLFVQRRSWDVALFNMGQYAITYGLAGLALQATHKHLQTELNDLPFVHMMLSAGAATLVYLLVNIPLVNGFVALKNQLDLTLKNWLHSFLIFHEDKVEITQTLFFFPIAVMVASFYKRDHNLVILGVLMALILGGLRFIEQRRKMEEQNQKLRTLYEINKELGEFILREAEVEITHQHLFETLLKPSNYQQIAQIIPNQRCSVYRVEKLGEDCRIVHQISDHVPEPEKNFHLDDEGPLQDMVRTKQGVLLNHLGHLPLPYVLWKKAYKAFIAQPLLIDDEVAYLLVLFRRHAEPFDQQDEQMLKLLAKPLEITLKNIQLRIKIQEQAIRDGLMGVFNHRYLKSKMEEELNRAKRYKKPLSLIISDVDYFKKFNDTHGHLLGDRVLKEVAQILQESVRETDIVARYGGEELAILLPETPLTAACEVAERIRRNVAQHAFVGKDNQNVFLSLSMGVTCTDEDPDLQVTELIIRADTALYKAKNQGRNQICQAIMQHGKLIIETYSQGASPCPADTASSVSLVDLKPETRQLWLEFFEKGYAELHTQLRQWVETQKTLKPVFRNEILQQLIPQLLNAFRTCIQTPCPITRNGHEWPEAIVQAFARWEQGLYNKLQTSEQLLAVHALCLQVCRFLLAQSLALPVAETEKKLAFEITVASTHALLQCLIKTASTCLEEQRNQLQQLLESIRRLKAFQTGQSNLEDTIGQIFPQLQQAFPQIEGVLLAFPDVEQGRFLTRVIVGVSPRAITVLQHRLIFSWPINGISPRQLFEACQPEQWGEHRDILIEQVPGLKALIFQPITHQREVKALLILLVTQPVALGNRQIRWLKTFAQELSFALVNRETWQEEEQRILRILKQMVDIFEAGTPSWRFHSERVSSLAGRLASRLGLPDHEQRLLRDLAYLHHLGLLVSPPDSKHPELLQMQQVLLGSRIVEAIPHLQVHASAIRAYAEHWDGSGFPDGLQGTQIPIYARLIGLASAFECMLQQGTSPHEAIETLEKTGYYDPSLCTLLKEMVEADEIKH